MIGKIVSWDTSSNMHKLQKRNPDFLLIIDKIDVSTYQAVPCWIETVGYTMTVLAKPHNLHVDAKKFVLVKSENVNEIVDFYLENPNKTIAAIRSRYETLSHNRFLKKIERQKQIKKDREMKALKLKKLMEKKESIENIYGNQYEHAVINNDRKQMQLIEARLGGDPRPNKSYLKSSTNLTEINNPKPFVGGESVT